MARSKRGVKFPNRSAGSQNGSDGRRSSFSDLSDEGQSPKKAKAQPQPPASPVCWRQLHFTFKSRTDMVA